MIVILPWTSYIVAHFITQGPIPPWSIQSIQQTQNGALNDAQKQIIDDSAQWYSPTWQTNMRKELAALGVQATIENPYGAKIFSTNHIGHGMYPNKQLIVVESGRQMGTVSLFVRMPHDMVASISAMLAVAFAVFMVSLQMRRYVVRPLEAMSHAARNIAGGNLDFEVPLSRVSEIAEVRAAFQVMGDGLRTSIKQQAKLEEERRFIVGAIAHDLRTPLFALRGYLEGLEQGVANSPEKAAKYVSVCKEKSDQLDRLVSDLFAFTKTEYMEQTMHRDLIHFSQVMERSVNSLRPQAAEANVEIYFDQPANTCEMEGDAHLLERAISNLLDNAIQHTPPQGRITIQWQADSARITFAITDTGPGFASVDLPHVFDPLYRGETSRNRETGGTGLGLTIAKRIIMAHGGNLTAANQIDGGARLTGWMPRNGWTI